MGGWKYLIPGQTGEFFHDLTDFKDSLKRIIENTRGGKPNPYKPLELVENSYGNIRAGQKLFEFVRTHWGDKISFPEGTSALIPTGA